MRCAGVTIQYSIEKGGLDMGKKVAVAVARVALNSVKRNANSVCTLYFYQPREPKDMRKYRKF